MSDYRLLVIDDEVEICQLICDIAYEAGYKAVSASKFEDFYSQFESLRPTFILVDLQLGENDGIEILRFLAQKKYNHSIAIMSGADRKILATAERLGKSQGLKISSCLQKPIKINEINELLAQEKFDSATLTTEQLGAAISQDDFVLHYQPKVEMKTGKIIGVEVLIRLVAPNGGLTYPDAFIPLAESSGLISSLTHNCMRKAIYQCALWQKAGIDLNIALNISALCLDDLLLPDTLFQAAKDQEVDPASLMIEITETGIMTNPQYAMDILTRLRLKGFKLAVDDFGMGNSSLVQLYRMPFNELKIDKTFITQGESDPEKRVITKAVVDLSHNLSLHCVAEGIESLDTWEWLQQIGCDIAQGYFIAEPMPVDKFIYWLERNANTDLIWQGKP